LRGEEEDRKGEKRDIKRWDDTKGRGAGRRGGNLLNRPLGKERGKGRDGRGEKGRWGGKDRHKNETRSKQSECAIPTKTYFTQSKEAYTKKRNNRGG